MLSFANRFYSCHWTLARHSLSKCHNITHVWSVLGLTRCTRARKTTYLYVRG